MSASWAARIYLQPQVGGVRSRKGAGSEVSN
jgi:hypothetical protein